MRTSISQTNRAGRITSVLGSDALGLLKFDGAEHVDGLFVYHVEAQAEAESVTLSELIGTSLTVSLTTEGHGDQHFNGIVMQARWIGNTEGHAVVQLVLEPALALLRYRRNQRIFHDVPVTDILQAVFGDHQLDYRQDLTGSYAPLEYTVQYRESDLNFALRLMERFGISYYFEHQDGAQTLVLVDEMTQYPEIDGGARAFLASADTRDEHFWDWQAESNMTTGAIRLTDFDFKNPATMMEVDRAGSAAYEHGRIESYDYPGGYLDPNGQGRAVAALRVEQERAGDDRHRAAGDVVSLRAGMQVSLTGQAQEALVGQAFLCLRAQHSYVAGQLDSSGGRDGDGTYTGQYVLTSADAPYAPARVTPPAMVYGPQTAIVVGPEGEQIDCDEYGRIKVRFHWDLERAHSMRCRVSQNWAGAGWGGMVIPRIGMEVVVEFLEGDPDKPLVTGCVYNDRTRPPYELPANKTRSTFKTDSHKAAGYNELRFEDAAGAEEIFVHGQKDMNLKIGNNQSERIDNNAVSSIGNNQATEIGRNLQQVVGGAMDLTVGASGQNTISPADADEMGQGLGTVASGLADDGTVGDLTITIDHDKIQTIGNDHTETIGHDRTETVGNDRTSEIGNNLSATVTSNWTSDVGGDVEINAGGRITLRAGSTLLLDVGGSKIELSSSGAIKVDGTMLDMKLGSLIKMAAGLIKLN